MGLRMPGSKEANLGCEAQILDSIFVQRDGGGVIGWDGIGTRKFDGRTGRE